MDRIIVICGPTATGKTELALKMARKFNGEIISADSRQIYRGMDIGTGKDLPENSQFNPLASLRARLQNSILPIRQTPGRQVKNKKYRVGYYLFEQIPVWLLDVVEPDQKFSVAQYFDITRVVIKDVWQRNKIPFLVGGTGFYIRAVIDGIETLGILPNWDLRQKLSDYSVNQLSNLLKELNLEKWESMTISDIKNPRRLIRAIEITMTGGKQKIKSAGQSSLSNNLNPLFIGLTVPYKLVYQRIDKRVDERIKKGVLNEVKSLLAKGYSWGLPSMTAMGYREFREFFDKGADFEKVIQRWKWNEHQYARRQMTWFKKDPRIHWFPATDSGSTEKMERLVRNWYN